MLATMKPWTSPHVALRSIAWLLSIGMVSLLNAQHTESDPTTTTDTTMRLMIRSTSMSTTTTPTRSSTSSSKTTNSPKASDPPNKNNGARHPVTAGQAEGFYYIIAALVIVFLSLSLWLCHVRRRKRRRLAAMAEGRGVLELDIDGMPYPNNRRWAGRNGVFTTRRDEGLDEHGEAPPPYKPGGPRNDHPQPQQQQEEDSATPGPPIPLQPIYANNTQAKPPDYHEQTAGNQYTHAQSSSTSTTQHDQFPAEMYR